MFRSCVRQADRAVGASLSSDAVPFKIDRFGPGQLRDAGTTARSG